MSDLGAAAALAGAREARARLAKKIECPPWSHAAFGLIYGTLVAAMGMPDGLIVATQAVAVVAALVMFVVFRLRMGFFVNGYRRGRTRPVVFGLLAAYFVCFGLAAWLRGSFNLHWPAFALALVMVGIGTWASRTWNRIYRAELTGGLGSA